MSQHLSIQFMPGIWSQPSGGLRPFDRMDDATALMPSDVNTGRHRHGHGLRTQNEEFV